MPAHQKCAAVVPSLSRVQLPRSPPGSSVHGMSQARELEWVGIAFSRGSFQPRDQTQGSCIGRQILYHGATRETSFSLVLLNIKIVSKGFPGGPVLKNPPANAEAVGSIPGPGRLHEPRGLRRPHSAMRSCRGRAAPGATTRASPPAAARNELETVGKTVPHLQKSSQMSPTAPVNHEF